MNPRSEDDAVYRAAGLALSWAQYFEAEIVNIVFLHAIARGQVPSRSKAERLLSVAEKTPLRRQLRAVLTRAKTQPDLTATFLEAVDQRNYLVHRFLWDHSSNLTTANGRDRMLQELHDITQLLFSAHRFAQLRSGLYLKQLGIEPEELARQVRQAS